MDPTIKVIEDDTEENRMLNSLFVLPSNFQRKFVEMGDEKYFIPKTFADNWHKISKMEVLDDDIFITGHPRSGTHWVREITLRILNANGMKNIMHLDGSLLYDCKAIDQYFPGFCNWEDLYTLEKPRILSTHLPWHLLPEQIQNGTRSPKIIHVLRNPKDVCISCYHFSILTEGYKGSFSEFCKLFLVGKLIHGPYFTTVKSYWKKRNYPNVFLLKYSDLIRDPADTIGKIASFLNRSLSEIEIESIIKSTSKDVLKKSDTFKQLDKCLERMGQVSNAGDEQPIFLRRGVEGGYKTEMSKEQQETFDRVTKQKFEKLDIRF